MYEGRLKSNAHMLVEPERKDLQKRARWHVEVTFPLKHNRSGMVAVLGPFEALPCYIHTTFPLNTHAQV
jgi:hypothetical protein